jgi:hypothetical protein
MPGARYDESMYGASALAEWIRAGGRPQRGGFGGSTLRGWQAFWFERNWQTQRPKLDALALPDDPVFILGFWRSGTTVLHELLTASTSWTTPRTWQCFNPSTCFLTKAPARDSAIGRPMDEGRITSLGPQEDEFALLLLGEPSAYRAFIDPRRFDECAALLRPEPSLALPRWLAFLRGIAAASPGNRLLLKSPNHSFRIPILRSAFPRARFIWAGRQPGPLLASNRKMWSAMIERYALWDCPPAALEAFLQQAMRACADALDRCVEEMPRESMLWIDFEELQRDPRRELGRVLRFLGSADDAAMTRSIEEALARIKIHAGGHSATPSSPEGARLERSMAAAREAFVERA